MVKRNIRLKEMQPGADNELAPSPEYRERADKSLGSGPFRTRTDTDGFLVTGNPVVEGAEPIVFLGDSFVESLYAAEDERFVAVLEREMRIAGKSVRCLNGGYSGATTLQLLNVLINKVFPIVGTGGRVVFFVPQSDANIIGLSSTYWNASKRNTTIVPGREPTAKTMPSGFEATCMILRLVVSACKYMGMQLVLAVSPYRVSDFHSDALIRKLYSSEDRYKRSQSLRKSLVEAVVDVANETGTPLLDIRMQGDSFYFYDELHLTDLGQKSFADMACMDLQAIFGNQMPMIKTWLLN